ncbi:ASKHA domain-containing protein [Methanogenium marinum]|uniref:ASKHA domain-containing protein n=1 Tax=Methanogenium marinum TaxID=348610 RepID=A0A9Q4PYK7_9EURY|nr:ASKHA domain-containing protein [Methanogenium marinum]MDE4908157.1 ASKHA domain-containing protein [Methanogenium marinum]
MEDDITVTFEPEGKTVIASSHTLLELAQCANIGLRGECGGKGGCGKCKIKIVALNGVLNEPMKSERVHLTDDQIVEGYRLGCQTRLLSGRCTVYVPPESRTGKRLISGVGLDEDVPLEPLVRKFHLSLVPPTFDDTRPDRKRLEDALNKPVYVPLSILATLPTTLRTAGWDVTAALWNSRVIAVEPGDTTKEVFGAAVDIGSSKVICHLVSLATGETVASANAENPQIMYGEDVVSRITYASKRPEHLQKMQDLIISTVNRLLDAVCQKSGIPSEQVYELVFVGNSVMHHLFLGISPKHIGVAPFVPVTGSLESFPAKELGVRMNPEGMVTAVPLIEGYIGSDAVANLLITRIYQSEKVSLTIDIGTNSEILLGNNERIFACSAPSGPSFEGAHISSGIKAVTGAIESVTIEGDTLTYTTIDDAKPKGICGSGVIDLVAELFLADVITKTGKFRDLNHPRIIEDGVPKFVIAWNKETATDGDITITEKDINEFLLAKGSLNTGWTILSRHYGISPSDIDSIYLAGSFGTHIDIENAITLSLIPDIDRKQIFFAGETAVGGAKMVLKSVSERKQLPQILRSIVYIELSVEPTFNTVYIKSIPLSPK